MANQTPSKINYDFSNKDPTAILTEDELANFDEGMKLKNTSKRYSQDIDFAKAAKSVVSDLDELFS